MNRTQSFAVSPSVPASFSTARATDFDALSAAARLAPKAGAASALTGCFKLAAGRAVTIEPRWTGVLRIAHGRVWVTVDTPAKAATARGDIFLMPGDSLVLKAGERMVMESWPAISPDNSASARSSWFMWDPVAQTAAEGSRWNAAVEAPLADLRRALVLALGAGGRLVLGVAGLAGLGGLGGRAARGARHGGQPEALAVACP